jgi:hypothetical protein
VAGTEGPVCPGASLTYSANSSDVTWSTSPAGFFSPAFGSGATFTTAVTASASGQGVITATFTNLPGTPPVTKTVFVGPPSAPEITLRDDDHDCKGQVVYTLDNYDPTVTYTFNRVWNISAGFFDPGQTVRVKSNAMSGTFTITATRCGVATTSQLYQADFCTDPIQVARATTAYPNPASESLTVPKGATDAVLLNGQGKAVAQPDKAGRLDVQRLPAGLYNLQMQQGSKRINQRIEVKH